LRETISQPARGVFAPLTRTVSQMKTRIPNGIATRAGVVSVTMVLLITTVGRMLGFVREVLISSSYGTSGPADAFFTVQQLPTIMSAFVSGPFMIAFIPYYAALREAGSQGEAVRGALRVTFVVGV